MRSADGTLTIVFNGEIFNAPELRAELEAEGHRFASDHSDTEVVLALYERRGEDFLAPAERLLRVRDLGRARGGGSSARSTASGSSRSTSPSGAAASRSRRS